MAAQTYPIDDDLYVKPLPDVKTFAEECFANGNILLTADRNENLHSFFRKEFALFADGTFLIARDNVLPEEFKTWTYFRRDYSQYVYMSLQYVPQEYLDAVYKKAREFPWYLQEKDCSNQLILDGSKISDIEVHIRQSIDKLFKDGTCLTFKTGHHNEFSDIAAQITEFSRTALGNSRFHYFSDGTLVYPDYFDGNHQQELEIIKNMLNTKGLPFKKLFNICNEFKDMLPMQQNEIIRTINIVAQLKYSEHDFNNEY